MNTWLPTNIVHTINEITRKGHCRGYWQITMQVTNRCLMKCVHCNQGVQSVAGHQMLPFDQLSNFIGVVSRDYPIGSVLVTGGEPLLYPQIEQLLEYLERRGIPVDLNSALLAPRNRLEVLFNHPPRTLRISHQGASSDDLEAFTQSPCWNVIRANAETIASLRPRLWRLEMSINVTCQTFLYLLDTLHWLIEEYQPDDIALCPVFDYRPYALEMSEVEEYYATVAPQVEYLAKFHRMSQLAGRARTLFGTLANYNAQHTGGGYSEVAKNCYAGTSSLFISADGNVYPCVGHKTHSGMPGCKQLGNLTALNDLSRMLSNLSAPLDPSNNAICRLYCPNFLAEVNRFMNSPSFADHAEQFD